LLTLLSVNKDSSPMGRFKRNKIRLTYGALLGADIRLIECILRHEGAGLKRIRSLCGEDAGTVLYSEELQLPEDAKIKRFASDELRSRLCLNMAIEMLKLCSQTDKEVKVSVYDPDGRIADGVSAMLKFAETVNVVTHRTELYSAEAERIMTERGAVLGVSRRMRSLSSSHLIVAPLALKTRLPCEKTAVILSTLPPLVPQKCALYYKYYFDLGEEFRKYTELGFDAEYLASALYTLCGRFDLGSVVPQATKGAGESHTLVSLAKYLINIA